MPNLKEVAKTAAIALVIVAVYHNGFLNWVPVVYTGAKK